jgi:transposase InsO family protein
MVTLAHIKEQFRLSLGSYGRPRMTEELKEIGLNVGHRRVGRLMRQNGISVVRTRKHKVTTDSNHKFNIAPNLLDHNFSTDQPNKKWAGDINLYLDPRRLAVSCGDPGLTFTPCHWLGRQQSDEA